MKTTKSILSLHILIYTIIFIFFCSYMKKVETNRKKFFVSDSLIYKNDSNELFNGIVVDTINNQIISYEVKDGIKDGIFKIKTMKDSLIMSGMISRNKNVGEWRYYYDNGKLETKGYFKNDLPDSIWIWYFPDGIMKERGVFKKGKRTGEWYSYDEKGKLIEKKAFSDSLSGSQ